MKPLTLTLNPRSLFLASIGLALAAGGWLAGQGPLTPPGAPAPTMKTLAQVEPRTPISALPFIISEPGSYYLTGSLTGTAAPGIDGITIGASGVTLDLMGFELVGGGSVGALGIVVVGTRTNIAVRNGTVRGWTARGIMAGGATNSQLDRLAVSSNGLAGMSAGSGSTVTSCVASNNGAEGISVLLGCTVSTCAAFANQGDGIRSAAGGTVTGCTATSNQANGIVGGTSTVINGCAARSNTSAGIVAGDGGSVSGCTAEMNVDGIVAGSGCTLKDSEATNNSGDGIRIGSGFGATTIRGCAARSNAGDGIEVFNSCLVVDNVCDSNGAGAADGAGIHVTGLANRIDGNHVTSNDRGIDVDNTPNLIVRNSASANATNWDISAGNRVGVTVIPPVGTAFTGHTGGQGVASTDPWANFTY